MIVEELDEELKRIKVVALSGANNAIEPMAQQIMDDAQEKVYKYPASSFAMSVRRGVENGGVGSREAIDIVAFIDGNDIVMEGKVSRTLQHPVGKDGTVWGADAVDVVVTGDAAFNQQKAGARPFIEEDKLNSILEDALYAALYEWM